MVQKRKRPIYDDEFRASAILSLRTSGYPDTEGALARVSRQLNVPAMTLSRWFRRSNNPPPNKVVTRQKGDLKTLFTDEIYEIMGVLPERREDASYQQLVTSMAIFFDKIRLLEGLPTEIFSILPDWLAAMDRRGLNAVDVIKTMTNRLNIENPNASEVQ